MCARNDIDLASDLEKNLQYVAKMCQSGLKCHFLDQEKCDRDIKNSPLVEPTDRKKTKEENKLPPN